MSAVNPKGNLDYNLNGAPFAGLPPKGGIKVELLDYNMNGAPFEYIIPLGGNDFFEFMWGA